MLSQHRHSEHGTYTVTGISDGVHEVVTALMSF